MIIFLTILIFILVLGVLIFAHELGHFIFAKRAGIKVEEFGMGFPPRIFGKKYKGTLYSLNLFPIGGFVKIYGEDGEGADKKESFASRSAWIRFKIIFAGVFFNVLLAILLLAIYFWLGGPTIITPPTKYTAADKTTSEILVWQAEPDSPASVAGLERGDVILSIAGEKVDSFSDLENVLSPNIDQDVEIKIRRDKEEKNLNIQVAEKDGKGFLGIRGIDNYLSAKYPWWKVPYIAVVESFKLLYAIIAVLFMYLKDLIVESKAPSDISGPVGIFIITKEIVKLGAKEVVRFAAVLSLNLVILNFLPIPGLDGGRAFFIMLEKIRGKKIEPRLEAIIHGVGFAFLIAIFLLITYSDVIKFIIKR